MAIRKVSKTMYVIIMPLLNNKSSGWYHLLLTILNFIVFDNLNPNPINSSLIFISLLSIHIILHTNYSIDLWLNLYLNRLSKSSYSIIMDISTRWWWIDMIRYASINDNVCYSSIWWKKPTLELTWSLSNIPLLRIARWD